jgi:hypothetical protein
MERCVNVIALCLFDLMKLRPRTLLHFGGIVRSRTAQFAHRFWHDHFEIKRKGQGGISRLISFGSTGSDDS